MRQIALVLLVFALPVPAPAEEPEKIEDAAAIAGGVEAARIALAKKAMETQIKLGDLLRAKGDLDGSQRAYAKAVAIFEEAKKGWSRLQQPAGKIVVEIAGGAGGVRKPTRKRRTGSRRKLEEIPAAAREEAIKSALKWLAGHQDVDRDGKWDCDGFMKHNGEAGAKNAGGGGGALHDVGATSLALLAFLGAGHGDRASKADNRYAKTVRMGLRYLTSSQDEDGCFGTRATHSFMYNHAMATLAMSEAYVITKNPRYKKPAQRGLAFLLRARNPYMAWRYEPRGGENDTSVTSWCVMALKSALAAGLVTDNDRKEIERALKGSLNWIDKMTDANYGQVGYNFPGGSVARPEGKQDRFPGEKSQAMTAAGILTRIHCGQKPRQSESITKGTRLCLDVEPQWDESAGTIDMYYWFIGTMALYHVGGKAWQRWNAALADAVVPHQRKKGAAAGSWDPAGAWGGDGGRVVSTALMAMSLQVVQRYDKAIR